MNEQTTGEMLRWLIAELRKPNCPVDATNMAAAVLKRLLDGIEEEAKQ